MSLCVYTGFTMPDMPIDSPEAAPIVVPTVIVSVLPAALAEEPAFPLAYAAPLKS